MGWSNLSHDRDCFGRHFHSGRQYRWTFKRLFWRLGRWTAHAFHRCLAIHPDARTSSLFSRSLVGNTATINILGRQFNASVIGIVFIIGLLNWMRLAHIIRAQVLTLKEQEFTTAAVAIGAQKFRIILRHILPNCTAPIIVNATLGIGSAIVTEAYLSFLGFGVLQPTATWGNILTGAQARLSEVPWLWLFPGLLIVLTVLAINFIGDGLRDALDPRSVR